MIMRDASSRVSVITLIKCQQVHCSLKVTLQLHHFLISNSIKEKYRIYNGKKKNIAILRQVPLKVPLFIRIKAKLLNMVCTTVYSVLNATLFNLFSLSLTLPASPLAIGPHSLITTRRKYSHCCTPNCFWPSYILRLFRS